MRSVFVMLAATCAVEQMAVAQEPVAVSKIIETLPGLWAMEIADPPGSKPVLQCERLATKIWFENDSARGLVYVSEAIGPEVADIKKEERQSRSPVRMLRPADGSEPRAIVLQYDGEKRLDDKGKPVVWVLVMPDQDAFLWHRADWPSGAFTAISRRCPTPDLVG